MRIDLVTLSLVGLAAGASVASGAEDEAQRAHFLGRFHQQKEGTPPPGKPRYVAHTDKRAGFPRSLAKHLEPSRTAGGIGYYVGGGVPWGRGQGRRGGDGTWGWDETGGRRHRHRTILGWSQGLKYQGGTGAYRTDGPVVPDLIYATTSTINSLGRRGDSP